MKMIFEMFPQGLVRNEELGTYPDVCLRVWILPTSPARILKDQPGILGLYLVLPIRECGALSSLTGHTRLSVLSSLSSPRLPALLISCLPAPCTPSAPHIPPSQYSAPRALSSLEDQTVVAKQSIQGTTVANCLTQANSCYFAVCLDYQWRKQRFLSLLQKPMYLDDLL